MKYVRILRLPDQYLQISAVIIAGIVLNLFNGSILLWILATTCLSVASFVINEIVDRKDTDLHSTFHIHILPKDVYNPLILALIVMSLTVIGLYLSQVLNLLPWAIAIIFFCYFYSIEPFRFKKFFFLDLFSQTLGWVILPMTAIFYKYGQLTAAHTSVAVVISLLGWSVGYPYQLEDFFADVKSKLKSTHITLGMNSSLRLGIVFGIIGILWFLLALMKQNPWMWPYVAMTFISLGCYTYWLQLPSLKSQVESLHFYVNLAKPLSQLLVIYLSGWWLLNL